MTLDVPECYREPLLEWLRATIRQPGASEDELCKACRAAGLYLLPCIHHKVVVFSLVDEACVMRAALKMERDPSDLAFIKRLLALVRLKHDG